MTPVISIKCTTCTRDPLRVNGFESECSHIECPHRRKAWSERPTRDDLFRGPWPKAQEADPKPLDGDLTKTDIHPGFYILAVAVGVLLSHIWPMGFAS